MRLYAKVVITLFSFTRNTSTQVQTILIYVTRSILQRICVLFPPVCLSTRLPRRYRQHIKNMEVMNWFLWDRTKNIKIILPVKKCDVLFNKCTQWKLLYKVGLIMAKSIALRSYLVVSLHIDTAHNYGSI